MTPVKEEQPPLLQERNCSSYGGRILVKETRDEHWESGKDEIVYARPCEQSMRRHATVMPNAQCIAHSSNQVHQATHSWANDRHHCVPSLDT